MGAYEEMLRGTPQLNVQEIVATCKALLPIEYKHRPYRHPELKNGIGLLLTEEGMNAYMAAYGEMHIAKCRAALQNFPFDIKKKGRVCDFFQQGGVFLILEKYNVASRRVNFFQLLADINLLLPSGNRMSDTGANTGRLAEKIFRSGKNLFCRTKCF